MILIGLLALSPLEPPMTCTVRLTPGAPAAPHLTEGATVCFAPGTHAGGLYVDTDLTLVGEPGAVLDAGGRGPVIHVAGDGITVTLVGLTLTGGHAELGAALLLEGDATVRLDGGGASGNTGGLAGGAGLGANRGHLSVRGGVWQDAFLTGFATAEATGARFLGEVRLREEASLTCAGCALDGGLSLRGSTTRRPSARLDLATTGTITNDPQLPGRIER